MNQAWLKRLFCPALAPALRHALTCPDLPCPALPCPVLPCPALPCPALPYLTLPYDLCPPNPSPLLRLSMMYLRSMRLQRSLMPNWRRVTSSTGQDTKGPHPQPPLPNSAMCCICNLILNITPSLMLGRTQTRGSQKSVKRRRHAPVVKRWRMRRGACS